MENVDVGWTAFQNSYYFWDVITALCGMICVIGGLSAFAWLLGLPGRIAVARNHPEAEAVYAMGWAGFLAVIPWINAFIWAFKPTDVVDIRRFPDEEAEAIKRDIAHLKKKLYGKEDETVSEDMAQTAPGTPDGREA